MSVRPLALLLMAMLVLPGQSEDPTRAYTALSQGRGADAALMLYRAAAAGDDWHLWCDAGLAAAEAGWRGHAVAWLLEAHRRAPTRREPRRALAHLDCDLPPTWLDRLGLLGTVTGGGAGLILLALSGLLLGWAAMGTHWRIVALIAGIGLVLLALPAQIAIHLDHHDRDRLVAAVRPSWLLDSTGDPTRRVPAGTILTRLPRAAWSGRILVELTDGSRGFIPTPDLDPTPPTAGDQEP